MRFKFSYIILMACILIVGCAASTNPTTNFIPSQSAIVSTQTLLPQTSLTSTLTPSSTVTIPVATITPHPTLSPNNADKTVAKMMKENGNCSSPCFWGIPQGSSDFDDSVGFITALAKSYRKDVFIQTKNFETIYYVHFVQKEKMDINIGFLERNKDLLNIKMRVSGLYDKNINNDDWLAFRPENILKTYGVPDYINLYLVAGPEGAYGYGFVFYYSQLIVNYIGADIIPARNTYICPLTEHHIQQFDFLVGKELEHTSVGEKSIEELTQLSVNDFYTLLTGDPKKACFNVNFVSYQK